MVAMGVVQDAVHAYEHALLLAKCLVLLLVLEAEPLPGSLRPGADLEQGQVLRQEADLLDEGVAEALGALDAAVIMELQAAVLAQGVAAENEQPGHVGAVVELGLAGVAVHIQII